MARIATERFPSAGALAEAFQRAVADPHANPFAEASTQLAPASPSSVRPPSVRPPSSEPAAFAPTLPATPQRVEVRTPVDSGVRRKKRSLRPPVWLFLPLLVGVCLVPSLGVAGFAGCSSWMTDVQLRVALQTVRSAVEEQHAPELGAELDQLEALHRADRVNLIAAAALNARVQHALRTHEDIDAEELPWVMEVVRDIVAHHGEYDLDQYSKMTHEIRGGS